MKNSIGLCGVLCAMLVGGFCIPVAQAKAESVDYVAENYTIDISDSEVQLPVPDVPNGWAYSIILKRGETVLGEQVTEYLFTQTGEYTLIYSLYDNGSLTNSILETATLNVVDTQKPTIETNGYDEEYFVGDTLTIAVATVVDNVDTNLVASVELYFGTESLSISENSYTFTKEGEYILIYKAIDASGNENTLSYDFTVLPKDTGGKATGCNGCSGTIIGGNLLGMGLFLLGTAGVLFIGKRSTTKK